ncbi:hypothetical protein [Aquirufa rosea]|nr:hypothetical protein [Aquirufa rosea]
MKNFVGKVLFLAFVCMAILIAFKYKEIKKEFLQSKVHAYSNTKK